MCTRQIVSPRRLPTLKTVSCGKSRSGVCGMEFVTMTSVNALLESRSTAGGENTACVAHAIKWDRRKFHLLWLCGAGASLLWVSHVEGV